LAVRRRKKVKRPASERVPLQLAQGVNQVWSMDFVSDSLANGRRIKCLTVADDFSHECVDLAVDWGSLTMRIINHIAQETGAAVLLLAHSPKAAGLAETADASAIAGSTAFVDQTRGAFILATMRPKEAKAFGISDADRQRYVSLTVVKNNYGKTGEQVWFTRENPPGWEVGVLVPIDLQTPVRGILPSVLLKDRIKDMIAAHPGQYSKTALRDKHSGKDGKLKASKSEVAAAIEDLLDGQIVTREPTQEERKTFDLPQQTKLVLAMPPQSQAPSKAVLNLEAGHAVRN
jgi:hypothetical protein